MARKRMVTRTISEHFVSIMIADLESSTLVQEHGYISGTIPEDDTKTILKAVKTKYPDCDTDTRKLVNATVVNTTEVVYGMPEDEFIRYAHIIER